MFPATFYLPQKRSRKVFASCDFNPLLPSHLTVRSNVDKFSSMGFDQALALTPRCRDPSCASLSMDNIEYHFCAQQKSRNCGGAPGGKALPKQRLGFFCIVFEDCVSVVRNVCFFFLARRDGFFTPLQKATNVHHFFKEFATSGCHFPTQMWPCVLTGMCIPLCSKNVKECRGLITQPSQVCTHFLFSFRVHAQHLKRVRLRIGEAKSCSGKATWRFAFIGSFPVLHNF